MENDSFWDFYWELRLQSMETLGKREAILSASRLVRLLEQQGRSARLLEPGCGEGQIIGSLFEAHSHARGIEQSTGIDYSAAALQNARRAYPRLRFIEGDFTDPALLRPLGQFDLVLLVNALHEVFSATFSDELQEVEVPTAKERVTRALVDAAERLDRGGWLLLFDGLEPTGDPASHVRLRFLSLEDREHFETFAREFRPFRIRYRALDPFRVETSLRDFARYIDKSIFLGKRLWQTEKLESYQYFTAAEFIAAFDQAGLAVSEQRVLTVNEEKWRGVVEIETPGVNFPAEHILITAQKPA